MHLEAYGTGVTREASGSIWDAFERRFCFHYTQALLPATYRTLRRVRTYVADRVALLFEPAQPPTRPMRPANAQSAQITTYVRT